LLDHFPAEVELKVKQNNFFEGFELRARFIRIFCKNNHGPGGGNFILVTNIRFFGNECPPLGFLQGSYIQQGFGQGGYVQQGFQQPGSFSTWLSNSNIKIHSWSSQHQDPTFFATNILDPYQTFWLSEPGFTTNQWIVFDFIKLVSITKLSIQVDNWECTVKDFNIEVSNNDDLFSWRCVKTFQAEIGTRNQSEQIFEAFEARGRYIRIFCKNNWGTGGGNFVLISNVRFFGI